MSVTATLEKNKVFVGLRSCDNVQTERSIFEYANWPMLQIKSKVAKLKVYNVSKSPTPPLWSSNKKLVTKQKLGADTQRDRWAS